MGLNYYTAREILRSHQRRPIRATATIGRLQHFLLPSQVRSLSREFGVDYKSWSQSKFGDFADGFFMAAGIGPVSAIDASNYENASIIHDMNEPVSSHFYDHFDLVVDGGSLEHIFRPEQALANSMRITSTGGDLIIWAPANNQCGHGFFQFSPEFFFSALTHTAGFELVRVLLVECRYPSVSLATPIRAFHVQNPSLVRSRVGATSRRPLMLLIHATKREHMNEPLAVPPQQSDYRLHWTQSEPSDVRPTHILGSLLRRSPHGLLLRNHILGLIERRAFSLHNRRWFTPDA